MMESQVVNRGRSGLTGFGCNSHHSEPGSVNLFGKLIDGYIGGSADENLPDVLSSKMEDKGSRSDSFASSRLEMK